MNRPLTRFVEWAVAPERVFLTIAALIVAPHFVEPFL